MKSEQTDTSPYAKVRFILVETSQPGNVGAAARAIKTMGFHQLIIVNPRFPDVLTHPEAIAFASGATDVLSSACIVGDIAEALEGVVHMAAVSARLREYSPPVVTPRAFAAHAAALSGDVAVVFGNERYGLPNEIVINCQQLINIPANPDYSSLNLAQAIQVVAYELRQAICDDSATNVKPAGELLNLPATAEQIDGMYAHLQQALVAIGFMDPENPKKLMPRIKRMFARSGLEAEEVNIVRGISKKILDKFNRN